MYSISIYVTSNTLLKNSIHTGLYQSSSIYSYIKLKVNTVQYLIHSKIWQITNLQRCTLHSGNKLNINVSLFNVIRVFSNQISNEDLPETIFPLQKKLSLLYFSYCKKYII